MSVRCRFGIAALGVVSLLPATVAVQQAYGNFSTELLKHLQASPNSVIEVAPMVTPGDAAVGTWITVPTDPFDTMLGRTSIARVAPIRWHLKAGPG